MMLHPSSNIALLSRPLVSMETRALQRAKWKVAGLSFYPFRPVPCFPPPAVFSRITIETDIWLGTGISGYDRPSDPANKGYLYPNSKVKQVCRGPRAC